jgi:hypothetical protein
VRNKNGDFQQSLNFPYFLFFKKGDKKRKMKKILVFSKKFYPTLTKSIKVTIEGENENEINLIIDGLKRIYKGYIREINE